MPTFYCLQFTQHQNKFREKHPFESFCNEQNALSGEIVSKRINKAIIGKLHDIILNQVPLDVGLIEIHALFCYATRDLHQLFPDFATQTSMGYHKLFFHFLIFGCFLGRQYAKYIALNQYKMDDNDYKTNEALRYCIDTFIPNLSKSNMRYKYTNSRNTEIMKTLAINYDLNEDIIHLITEFTAFHFEEFFIDILHVQPLWDISNSMVRLQLRRFIVDYCGMGPCTTTLFILPKCLLTSRFISPNSENLIYFANVIQFELIGQCHMVSGVSLPHLIQEIYEVPYLTITPWTDVSAFIDLFELLDSRYLKACSIVDLFEKCIDIESDNVPLSIVYNGHLRRQNHFRRIQEKHMQLMHQNIDVLFDDFLIKYCVTKASVMQNVFYQIINSLIYFLQWNGSNDTNALKETLINKLTRVAKMCIVPHINYNEFIKISKYKQSLENLKQLTSFETNLFDGKSEETSLSSDEQSKKRTLNPLDVTIDQRPLKRTKFQ
eukprot:273468_1